jgi:predicted small integral membrane protein
MRLAFFAISCGLLVASVAHAQLPTYTSIYRLGLNDAEHTNTDGAQLSQATRYYPSLDWIGGTSNRYSAGAAAGQSAWIWSRAFGTVRVGLLDAEHTRVDGLRNSNSALMSAGGFMAGWSDRYIGAAAAGRSAWRATAFGGTTRLGFADAAHTRADGFQNSEPRFINPAGSVVGWSDRYLGAAAGGRSAWIWSLATGLTRLGMTDAVHTNSDGSQRSDTNGLNALGRVIGTSTRYQGAPGTSAWTWSPDSGYTTLGYVDAQHTSSTGIQASAVDGINDAGRVIGRSSSYSGTTFTGNWAWTWTDAEHNGGSVQESSAISVLPSGRIIGYSVRYPGGIALGTTAWTWTASAGTVRLGLIDAEHTRSTDGERIGGAGPTVTDAFLLGHSSRYVGTCSCGQSGWIWSENGGTVRVGLYDAVHTRADGFKQSKVVFVNSIGQAVGFSVRFSGSTPAGSTGWFFDPALGTQALPEFSVSTTGASTTQPTLITDSGIVFGSFNLYSGPNAFVPHAFAWSPQMGLVDLGTLVPGGLPTSDWTGLNSVIQTRGTERILGAGSGETILETAPYVLAARWCSADFNNSGGLSVQDIFDFLGAWFMGTPSADFNGANGIDVQDIFDFLNGWLAGCA